MTFTQVVESAPVRTSATTLTAVRHLLTDRRMGAAFQPIWNLDTRQVMGYEGLARPASEYGLAGPQDAFAGAARLGCIDELDALCRASVLAEAGDLPRDVRLFLNVSPEVLDHGGETGERLQHEVEAAGLHPEQIVIELPERAGERSDRVVPPVQQLRDLGFGLALDDVGSGDSGLGLLGKVRPDYVKVDRGVVCSAREGGPGRAVLAALIAYAAESGEIVIAEGIETEDLLQLAGAARTVNKRARFVGAQGYLLGRPDAEPAWRSATRVRWPLPGMVMGRPELEAAALESACWCSAHGGA